MKEREEYHEVYGWMPSEIINHLPAMDRQKMFFNWIMKKPTATGWFITRTVVAALGERFINYMADGLIRGLEDDGEPVTKESLTAEMTSLMENFATDANILAEYIREYREKELHLDDESCDEEKEETVQESKSWKRDPKTGRFSK